jgi:hypothetical protein
MGILIFSSFIISEAFKIAESDYKENMGLIVFGLG